MVVGYILSEVFIIKKILVVLVYLIVVLIIGIDLLNYIMNGWNWELFLVKFFKCILYFFGFNFLI